MIILAACPCRNGENDHCKNNSICNCTIHSEEYFYGNVCQYVNLTKPDKEIYTRTVLFKWEHPPKLRSYAFVFSKTAEQGGYPEKLKVNMTDNERTLLLYRLESDKKEYLVCLLEDIGNTNYNRTTFFNSFNDTSKNENCLKIITRESREKIYFIMFIISFTLIISSIVFLFSVKLIDVCNQKRLQREKLKVEDDSEDINET